MFGCIISWFFVFNCTLLSCVAACYSVVRYVNYGNTLLLLLLVVVVVLLLLLLLRNL